MSNTRQQLLDAIVTRLKTITIANGYNLQIGPKVYDWKLSPLVPADLPVIEVRDTESSIDITDLDGNLSHRLKITIVVLATGLTPAATARKGLEDISRAINSDRWFGDLVKSFEPESTNIELIQDEYLLAAGQYTCTTVYYTNAGEI